MKMNKPSKMSIYVQPWPAVYRLGDHMNSLGTFNMTTAKQSTTKLSLYFLGYTVLVEKIYSVAQKLDYILHVWEQKD